MTENIDSLNGVYMGIVSLVCLLTYLAVSREVVVKKRASRSLMVVLRSYLDSLMKLIQPSRGPARIS